MAQEIERLFASRRWWARARRAAHAEWPRSRDAADLAGAF